MNMNEADQATDFETADKGRPELTLPPDEAVAVKQAYGNAKCILEYGSGGSTALASELPGKVVFSVESDRQWAANLSEWLASRPRPAVVHMHYADIGPTSEWGYPADEAAKDRWPSYATSVWKRRDFQHPDVVLIDGRFRVGCFLTVLLRTRRPIEVLFDDYTDRPQYHVVEELVKPVEIIGRMARFKLKPRWITPRIALMRRRAFMKPL